LTDRWASSTFEPVEEHPFMDRLAADREQASFASQKELAAALSRLEGRQEQLADALAAEGVDQNELASIKRLARGAARDPRVRPVFEARFLAKIEAALSKAGLDEQTLSDLFAASGLSPEEVRRTMLLAGNAPLKMTTQLLLDRPADQQS
jgi:hypothetical protein